MLILLHFLFCVAEHSEERDRERQRQQLLQTTRQAEEKQEKVGLYEFI